MMEARTTSRSQETSRVTAGFFFYIYIMAKPKRMKTMKEVSKHFEEFAKKDKVMPITERDFNKPLKKALKRGSK